MLGIMYTYLVILLSVGLVSPRAFPSNDVFGFTSGEDDQGDSSEACEGLQPFHEALEKSVETLSRRYCPGASISIPCVTPTVGVLKKCVEDGNLNEECVEKLYKV